MQIAKIAGNAAAIASTNGERLPSDLHVRSPQPVSLHTAILSIYGNFLYPEQLQQHARGINKSNLEIPCWWARGKWGEVTSTQTGGWPSEAATVDATRIKGEPPHYRAVAR